MVKLRRKPTVKTSALVDSINQIDADAEGITLKQFYINEALRRKAQENYQKTHWVNVLTDAQKFYIATTTDKPHEYMELPLSKGNETALAVFKQTSKNYKAWVIKNNTFMRNEFPDAYEKEIKPTLNKAMEAMRRSTAPLRKATETIAKEYQELGRKLRTSSNELSGIMSLAKVSPLAQLVMAQHKLKGEHKIAVSNGLNSYMSRHKMKKPIDIAQHYLDTHEDIKKVDYVVDSYDNPIAYAQATGISHKRLFEMVCKELVTSKTKYERIEFERKAYAIEELLNLFDSKVASSKHTKYTQKLFYSSKDRKAWSDKYNYNWSDYKRFNADYIHWNKVFKAEAKLRAESDADMMADFLSNPNK